MIPLYSPMDRFLAQVCFLLVAAVPAVAQSSAWNGHPVEAEAVPYQPVVVTGSRLQALGEVAAEQVRPDRPTGTGVKPWHSDDS